MRLVLGEELVAERAAGRVEDDADQRLGAKSFSSFASMLSTPSTAPVGSPFELVSGGSAWKARYRYDEPSTSTSRGRLSHPSAFLPASAPALFQAWTLATVSWSRAAWSACGRGSFVAGDGGATAPDPGAAADAPGAVSPGADGEGAEAVWRGSPVG